MGMYKYVCCYKESYGVIFFDIVLFWLGMRGYLLCCVMLILWL